MNEKTLTINDEDTMQKINTITVLPSSASQMEDYKTLGNEISVVKKPKRDKTQQRKPQNKRKEDVFIVSEEERAVNKLMVLSSQEEDSLSRHIVGDFFKENEERIKQNLLPTTENLTESDEKGCGWDDEFHINYYQSDLKHFSARIQSLDDLDKETLRIQQLEKDCGGGGNRSDREQFKYYNSGKSELKVIPGQFASSNQSNQLVGREDIFRYDRSRIMHDRNCQNPQTCSCVGMIQFQQQARSQGSSVEKSVMHVKSIYYQKQNLSQISSSNNKFLKMLRKQSQNLIQELQCQQKQDTLKTNVRTIKAAVNEGMLQLKEIYINSKSNSNHEEIKYSSNVIVRHGNSESNQIQSDIDHNRLHTKLSLKHQYRAILEYYCLPSPTIRNKQSALNKEICIADKLISTDKTNNFDQNSTIVQPPYLRQAQIQSPCSIPSNKTTEIHPCLSSSSSSSSSATTLIPNIPNKVNVTKATPQGIIKLSSKSPQPQNHQPNNIKSGPKQTHQENIGNHQNGGYQIVEKSSSQTLKQLNRTSPLSKECSSPFDRSDQQTTHSASIPSLMNGSLKQKYVLSSNILLSKNLTNGSDSTLEQSVLQENVKNEEQNSSLQFRSEEASFFPKIDHYKYRKDETSQKTDKLESVRKQNQLTPLDGNRVAHKRQTEKVELLYNQRKYERSLDSISNRVQKNSENLTINCNDQQDENEQNFKKIKRDSLSKIQYVVQNPQFLNRKDSRLNEFQRFPEQSSQGNLNGAVQEMNQLTHEEKQPAQPRRIEVTNCGQNNNLVKNNNSRSSQSRLNYEIELKQLHSQQKTISSLDTAQQMSNYQLLNKYTQRQPLTFIPNQEGQKSDGNSYNDNIHNSNSNINNSSNIDFQNSNNNNTNIISSSNRNKNYNINSNNSNKISESLFFQKDFTKNFTKNIMRLNTESPQLNHELPLIKNRFQSRSPDEMYERSGANKDTELIKSLQFNRFGNDATIAAPLMGKSKKQGFDNPLDSQNLLKQKIIQNQPIPTIHSNSSQLSHLTPDEKIVNFESENNCNSTIMNNSHHYSVNNTPNLLYLPSNNISKTQSPRRDNRNNINSPTSKNVITEIQQPFTLQSRQEEKSQKSIFKEKNLLQQAAIAEKGLVTQNRISESEDIKLPSISTRFANKILKEESEYGDQLSQANNTSLQ